jgi:porphobilinogen synthase
MPGVFQLSVDEAVKEAAAAKADGVPGVLLFGLPDDKDATGSKASDPDAPVQSAVRALKREVPELIVITDVCLCEYTSHGHCGILDGEDILNDVTVAHVADGRALARRGGADFGRPLRHDGRARRRHPDASRRARASTGTASCRTPAKYCSAFYGPFREAADSAPQFGDRRSTRWIRANVEEALREGREPTSRKAPTSS